MRKMSSSDCSALPRLLTLAYDASQLTTVAEPLPGFKPAITASSFLLDLIKRNRPVVTTRQQCERVVSAIKRHTRQDVSLQTREYVTRTGRIAKLFGIRVDAITLWLVYGASEPRDTVDLSLPFTPDAPQPDPVALATTASVVRVDPLPLTYYAAIRALPEKQRDWLQMQHEAMYRAIHREDLYDLYCREVNG